MKKILIGAVVVAVAGLWGYSKFKTASTQKIAPTQQTPEKRTLHLFAMSDYFPAEVLKKFETDNNCEVRYDNFSSNEELLAKLQAGATGYDVIVPSDYVVHALVANKLIQPLDKSKLTNLKNLAGDFNTVPYDTGNQYTVPYTWGTTGLIYNTQHVKPKAESWDMVFQKEYAGHVSMLDDAREVLSAMLRSNGQSVNSTDKTILKAAQQKLMKLKPALRLFASDPKQHVLSGDVWIAHIYSGDANQLTKSNPNLKYFVPKEGGVVWIDNMAIPAKAPNVELAHAFINTILDAQVAKTVTEELLYSSPNTSVETSVKDEALRPSSIKKMSKQLEFLQDLGTSNEVFDQLWTEAKSL